MIPGRWREPVLLDGAMGTALMARGLPAGAFPEEWVVTRLSEVVAVHRAHVRAGARVALTCTFNAARLEATGLAASIGEVCGRAVRAAREAGAPAVAGCVGATGLAQPRGGGPSDGELLERYDAAFRALCAAGVDLLWTESHLALREARAALAAARRRALPVVATAFLHQGPRGWEGLDGVPAIDWLEALWRDGASAVGVNCVLPGPGLAGLAARAAARVPLPLVVKASAGLPGAIQPPEAWGAALAPVLAAGARWVGGCCGTGARHLRALGRALARA